MGREHPANISVLTYALARPDKLQRRLEPITLTVPSVTSLFATWSVRFW